MFYEKVNFSEKLPQQIGEVLYRQGLHSVIVEGGARTIQTFIDANLWDEAYRLIGKSSFEKGICAPKLSGNLISEEEIKGDIVKCHKNYSL